MKALQALAIAAALLVAPNASEPAPQAIAPSTVPSDIEHLPLRDALARLKRYLDDYAERLTATIALEHYEQICGPAPSEHVVLSSEFGVMRVSAMGGWLGIRDVLAVNGTPIVGHEGTLEQILTSPSAVQQARRIAQQNARFNVGPFERTINDPVLVLHFLDGPAAAEMRYTRESDALVEGALVWSVRFEERSRPTVIRTPDGRDQPSRGTAWFEPRTGRLTRAQLVIDAKSFRSARAGGGIPFTATVDVVFRDEPRLGFWVPSEMTEKYEGGDQRTCSGLARYSDYRMFGVHTRIVVP